LSVVAVAPVALVMLIPSPATGSRVAVGSRASARAESAVSLSRQKLRLHGSVSYLAADGGRVALVVRHHTIVVWNPSRPTVNSFGAGTFGGKHPWGALWPDGVALAGNTVAWAGLVLENAHEADLAVTQARLGGSSKPHIATWTWTPDQGGTDYLFGDLRSGDGQIGFDDYYVCDFGDPNPKCPSDTQFDVASSRTLVLDAGTTSCNSLPNDRGSADYRLVSDSAIPCQQIFHTDRAAPLLAVGGGRFAIGLSDGSIALLDASGTTLATITPTQGTVRAVALDAEEVVVLVRTPTGRGVLEIYDPNSAALVHSLTVPGTYKAIGGDPCNPDLSSNETASATWDDCAPYPSLRLQSAAKGVVAYTLNRTLHLLRISDQRNVTVAAHHLDLHAQLDQSGLFYTYAVHNKRYPDRVVHLTWNAVDQLLS